MFKLENLLLKYCHFFRNVVCIALILIMKKDTLQQQFSFCHQGQETISLFLIISTVEQNASESRKM